MSKFRDNLTQIWFCLQETLFPWLGDELGALTQKQRQLVTVLEMIRLEDFIFSFKGFPGRPLKNRVAIARAFVAKAVYNLPTTRHLLDRLACDPVLRRLCGWERQADIPNESTFSRAFAEFAASGLPERIHESLIKNSYEGEVVGHLSRDATEIEAREKPAPKPPAKVNVPAQRGRPKKGEERAKPLTRRQGQAQGMPLEAMLDERPKVCDVGCKKNSKGHKETWIGYKLHLDVADGSIPISAILTSASAHDSRVALPLAKMSESRVTHLYDVMDSAYDAPEIREMSRHLGHVALIDVNPRSNAALQLELEAEQKRCRRVGHRTAEQVRVHERSTVERVNGCLKDEFGGRFVRVRGAAKVMCHLMGGVLALTVNQMIIFVT